VHLEGLKKAIQQHTLRADKPFVMKKPVVHQERMMDIPKVKFYIINQYEKKVKIDNRLLFISLKTQGNALTPNIQMICFRKRK
jgi:hypothetical protein